MTPPSSVRSSSSPTATPDIGYEEEISTEVGGAASIPDHPTPPPDYSSPEPDPDKEYSTDYLEIAKALEKSIDESEEGFENGFHFPEPPSPDFFTEAPTPEFIGQSNGYCSQEWNCTASSCSSLPTPATPPFNPPLAPGLPLPNFLLPLHTQAKYQWLSHNNAGDKVHNKVATSNVLVDKMKKSEKEVIKEWLENIFKTWEKTNDLEIKEFKLTQLKHDTSVLNVENGGLGSVSLIRLNGASNGQCGSHHQQDTDIDRLVILKLAEISAMVKGLDKDYSVIIKVLPTDDNERYKVKHKFRQLLKFSKEVQVYMKIIKCMYIFDEKRYTSACVEPPVPKLFFAQMDALNDCLVMENLSQDGFVKFSTKFGGQKTLSDMDHCRIVLRALAHFHAYSTIIQRDSEEPLLDLWPFAVEASNFREIWGERMRPVKEQVCQYLMWRKSRPENKISAEVEEKVENAIQELFWKLVKLRVKPDNERITVLIHGAANLDNIMFSYDEMSGRPNQAKLVDFSKVAVSSPVVDVSYFLYSSVHPLLISEHYVALLQAYHNAHLEAIKGFGMHGYEMDFEVLVEEYQSRIDYGVMTSCLVKPALYIVQKTGPRVKLVDQTCTLEEQDEDESDTDLRIDSSCIPLDLRLCSHLATLSRICPCPCAFTAQHSVTRDMITDSREDLTNSVAAAVKEHKGKFRGLDCNRGTKTVMKRILHNLMNNDGKRSKEKESSQSTENLDSVS